MCKLIAHRGLFNGPDKSSENHPAQINRAIDQGYDCEIDLWVMNSELWLGHDGPQYFINDKFLKDNTLALWIHAKNLAALRWLTDTNYRYFWHQNDDFVLTSDNWIWTYPGKELTMRSIQVMPEWNDPNFENLNVNCFGICSDFVEIIKEKLQS